LLLPFASLPLAARVKIRVWVESDGVKDRGIKRESVPWRVRPATGPVPTREPGV